MAKALTRSQILAGEAGPTAARLIATATDLFYRRGFRAVGVEELASAAGVAKPTLYRKFPSKDALVAACLEQVIQAERQALEILGHRYEGDPAGLLRAILTQLADRIQAPDYRGWLASNAAAEICDPEHPARRLVYAYKTDLREMLTRLAQAAGLIAPSVLADGLLMLIEGAAASRHTFDAQGPSMALIEVGQRLLGLSDKAEP